MTEARANSTLEVDYLVIGAGAMGMAFVDTLLSETDATIAIIDRNHKPGGHWTNAYPFVRLHQPSVFYGVISKGLGTGAIDADGPNAGLNELASADEILDYFDHVMRDTFLKSGRVSYFPMSNYDGADPARLGVERFHSLVTGAPTDVIVGRRVVDATYQNVSIPATTPPRYEFADGVEVVPPNALVKLSSPWARYTVVGSGKTGIDACLWLLEHDVDPDNITWIMPRDAWLLDRAGIQPQPAGVAPGTRGVWLQGALEATESDQVLEAFEAAGMVMRLTPDVRPTAYRCATVTHAEIASLRRIKNIVRRGRVKRLNVDSIELDDATIPAHPDTLYIDCTSDGLERRPTVPVYEGSKITLQCIIPCQQVFSAALIAHIEATTADDATRNEVCVPAPHPDSAQDLLGYMIEIAERVAQWGSDAELLAWLNQSRSVITFPAEVDLPRQQMAGELVAKVRAKYADILAWDAAIVS